MQYDIQIASHFFGPSGSTEFVVKFLQIARFSETSFHTKCALWSSVHLISETFFNPRIIWRDIIKLRRSSRKSQLLPPDRNHNLIRSTEFSKNRNVKFHTKPFCQSRCSTRTHRHEGAFRCCFVQAPKKTSENNTILECWSYMRNDVLSQNFRYVL